MGRWKVLLGILLLATPPTWAKLGTFWHITDLHYDVNYTVADGNVNDMCWKTKRGAVVDSTPGPFGDPRCDAPWSLIDSAVSAMQKISPSPDFIMWTGDYTAHVDDDFFSTAKIVQITADLTKALKSKFSDTPFLPMLGNHDYFPKDQFPAGGNAIQAQIADLWKEWLKDEYEEFKSDGRYTRDIPGTDVTVVALNTLLWYSRNKVTASDDADPGGHFKWADDVLTKLAKRQRKVFIMGHIPPGRHDASGSMWYQKRFNEQFIELVQKHSDIITAQFYGHQHTDAFRLIFDANNTEVPVSYLLLGPAVTPWSRSNPAVRSVTYDTITGELKEISTYYLDLPKANDIGKAEWELEYSFTNYYNLPAITPETLNDLAKQMKDNKTLFDRYFRAHTVRLEDPSVCQQECRQRQWCALTAVDYDGFEQCNEASLQCNLAAGTLATVVALLLALR